MTKLKKGTIVRITKWMDSQDGNGSDVLYGKPPSWVELIRRDGPQFWDVRVLTGYVEMKFEPAYDEYTAFSPGKLLGERNEYE